MRSVYLDDHFAEALIGMAFEEGLLEVDAPNPERFLKIQKPLVNASTRKRLLSALVLYDQYLIPEHVLKRIEAPIVGKLFNLNKISFADRLGNAVDDDAPSWFRPIFNDKNELKDFFEINGISIGELSFEHIDSMTDRLNKEAETRFGQGGIGSRRLSAIMPWGKPLTDEERQLIEDWDAHRGLINRMRGMLLKQQFETYLGETSGYSIISNTLMPSAYPANRSKKQFEIAISDGITSSEFLSENERLFQYVAFELGVVPLGRSLEETITVSTHEEIHSLRNYIGQLQRLISTSDVDLFDEIRRGIKEANVQMKIAERYDRISRVLSYVSVPAAVISALPHPAFAIAGFGVSYVSATSALKSKAIAEEYRWLRFSMRDSI